MTWIKDYYEYRLFRFVYFIIFLFIIIAILFIYSSLGEQLKIRRTRYWIKTKASALNMKQLPAGAGWRVEFYYSYFVDGQTFQKSAFVLSPTAAGATRMALNLEAEGLHIRFDLKNPDRSVFYVDEVYDALGHHHNDD